MTPSETAAHEPGLAGLPEFPPDAWPSEGSAGTTQFRLPTDLLDYARNLALAIAAQMLRQGRRSVTPGVGQTLRLLAIHDGHLTEPLDELDRARLAALKAVLQNRKMPTGGNA